MINREVSGQFKKGCSGNAGNRGRSSANQELNKLLTEYKNKRNQFTLGLFQRIESLGDSLISKAVDMAMEGNEKMLLFLLEKGMNHNLINRLEKPLVSKTVEDIDKSQQFVIEKMGDGTIDVNHGERLVKTLALKRDTIDVRELTDQVKEILSDEQK